jgi:hypothetical protein
MSNILCPRESFLHPDIKVGVQVTASMNTGDGIFADTDLMDLPEDGYMLVNITGDAVTNTVEIPQLNHHPTYTNPTPVLNAGLAPAMKSMVCYKIRAKKGSKPVCMLTLAGSNCYALGLFFRGRQNPIGYQAPDIVVTKKLTASAANVLEDTDLEDPGYPGWIYTWVSSNQADTQVAIRQRNYKTGHYSLAPTYAAGLACDCDDDAAWKEYVRQGGEPSVTVTEDSEMAAFLVSAFYVDKRVPEQSLWR